MMEALKDIEAERQTLGIPKLSLSRGAGISVRSYYRILEQGQVNEAQLKALRRSLRACQKGEHDQGEICQWVKATYVPICALVARDLNVDVRVLHDNPAHKKATSNPDWMRAEKLRRFAVYLMNTRLGFTQTKLAKGLGLTVSAVSQMCSKVEEQRDDPIIEKLLTDLELEIAA